MRFLTLSTSLARGPHIARARTRLFGTACTLLICASVLLARPAEAVALRRDPRLTAVVLSKASPTRSSNIRLVAKDTRLLVVNRETNSLTVLSVRRGNSDDQTKVAEIPVGLEPHCVTSDPNSTVAFVTNTASGTVSVISLAGENRFKVVKEIRVGTEPRGCARTPNGKLLFVANYGDGTLSVIDIAARAARGFIQLGGHPNAIAITDDGDKTDTDETVFVSDFFSELIPGKRQPFNDARRGVLWAFPSSLVGSISKIALSPIANSGFTADRSKFCKKLNPDAQSDVYCPDPTATVANDAILNNPQGVFPNLFWAALIRGGKVYLPNTGASPEPPVKFNVNVQGLVHVVDAQALTEQSQLHVNLNAEVKAETAPADPTASLDKLFANDLVAIDADAAGKIFVLVSQGGNFAFKAGLDSNGKLTLGTPVMRYQTGNLPTGVAVSRDGKRAYVNNDVNLSVTAINLEQNRVIARDIPVATPPAPGTFDHAVLVGKLTFFTALGTPDDGLLDTPVRDIVPLSFRGKASDNAWSSCHSCHPDGLTDNVTWSFPDGPRQTISLASFFAKDNPADQRISNWSAVRGSVTDFNNNSRAVQGGKGFAGDPPNPNIYNHGFAQGASDALDLMTLWVQTVRAPILPQLSDAGAGRTVFAARCASCHGGAKWSKSQVLYLDNPAFTADPGAGGVPRDPGVTTPGAGQIQRYQSGTATIQLMDAVGTFSATNELEIRGAGGNIGKLALGAAGFNAPSLLGVASSPPYFHDGSAETLDDVFARHLISAGGGGAQPISSALGEADRGRLKAFLQSIDGRTDPLPSDGDAFRDLVAGGS